MFLSIPPLPPDDFEQKCLKNNFQVERQEPAAQFLLMSRLRYFISYGQPLSKLQDLPWAFDVAQAPRGDLGNKKVYHG